MVKTVVNFIHTQRSPTQVRHHHPLEVIFSVLFRNMYAGLGMIAGDEDEEAELQYDEDEILDHFEEFWDDILPEFEAFGEILQLRVCR